MEEFAKLLWLILEPSDIYSLVYVCYSKLFTVRIYFLFVSILFFIVGLPRPPPHTRRAVRRSKNVLLIFFSVERERPQKYFKIIIFVGRQCRCFSVHLLKNFWTYSLESYCESMPPIHWTSDLFYRQFNFKYMTSQLRSIWYSIKINWKSERNRYLRCAKTIFNSGRKVGLI